MKNLEFRLGFSYYPFMLLLVVVILSSCSVQKTGTEKDFNELTRKLESGETIRIEVDAAYPLNTFASQQVLNNVLRGTGDTANRIDLSGDGHYLEFDEERAVASLPFYGERRQGGGYNNVNDSGINFDDVPKDYNVTLKENTYIYDVEFEANKGVESYNVDVVVFASGDAVINIISSSRTRIEYRGKIIYVE